MAPLIRYPHSNNSLLNSGNTKKAMTYEPRTETISPAINDDILNAEDSNSKSTKDEQTLLVEKLKKVEAEILQTDIQIARLRKQKDQLEKAASSASNNDEDQENVCDTKQLSIAKLVYHENRSKAQKAHLGLECLGNLCKDLPLYNQPSDNAIYHQNAAKFHQTFKTSLISCFKERLKSRLDLEESISTEYDRRMKKWLKTIELEDSQPSKRTKDAKNREFYEKQFPELKKARESGERFSRVGQRVARSDAELDEILDGITEREDQDKKIKSYAVIPPMLEEMRPRKPKYINTNGYVEDIIAEYKEYQILNTWTEEEKDIFRENYLQHPKNFGLIASMTSRKNVANCVQYYYLSKKSENYKQLLKRQQKRRTRSFVRPQQQTPANIEINTDANKTNGFTEKQSSDLPGTAENAAESNSVNKTNAINDTIARDIKNVGAFITANDSTLNTCCVCACDLTASIQSRNVTRSNHQLYGIGADILRPGMRICYSCRFRHIRHPGFDEVQPSPEQQLQADEPVEAMCVDQFHEPILEHKSESDNMKTSSDVDMKDDAPVDLNDQTAPAGGPEPNKVQVRTCVRDIIYQAIEMSFQKSKPSDGPENQAKIEPMTMDTSPAISTIPPLAPQNQAVDHNPIAPNKPQAVHTGIPNRTIPTHIPWPIDPIQQMHGTSRLPPPHKPYPPMPVHGLQQTPPPPLPPTQACMQPTQPPPPAPMVASAAHPLNLCRKFGDAPLNSEIPRVTTKIRSPPMAHGANVKNSQAQMMMGNGVLNLSKQTFSGPPAAPIPQAYVQHSPSPVTYAAQIPIPVQPPLLTNPLPVNPQLSMSMPHMPHVPHVAPSTTVATTIPNLMPHIPRSSPPAPQTIQQLIPQPLVQNAAPTPKLQTPIVLSGPPEPVPVSVTTKLEQAEHDAVEAASATAETSSGEDAKPADGNSDCNHSLQVPDIKLEPAAAAAAAVSSAATPPASAAPADIAPASPSYDRLDSPQVTGSPTSPGEMVIDESADMQSPLSSQAAAAASPASSQLTSSDNSNSLHKVKPENSENTESNVEVKTDPDKSD